jgi:hypothetical protein
VVENKSKRMKKIGLEKIKKTEGERNKRSKNRGRGYGK